MSALELYTKATRKARGMQHLIALRALRAYIKETRRADLRMAIRRMTDLALLRTLWEAGLDVDLQREVLRRADELITRRRE